MNHTHSHKPIVIALPGVNAYLLRVAPPPTASAEDRLVAAAAGPSAAAASVEPSVTGFVYPPQGVPVDAEAKAFVLVDTGFSWTWSRLRKALDDAGCVPGNLRLIAITHGDPDHTGNVLKLRDEYQTPIAMHRADADIWRTAGLGKRTSPSLKGRMVLRMGRLLGLFRSSTAMAFTPDVFFDDGMRLDAYGLAARVIHIPGHTPGSVAILTDDGSLFSGDTLFDSRHPLLLMQNPDDFRCSVAELCKLENVVTTVYPGHGRPFPGKNLGRIRV